MVGTPTSPFIRPWRTPTRRWPPLNLNSYMIVCASDQGLHTTLTQVWNPGNWAEALSAGARPPPWSAGRS